MANHRRPDGDDRHLDDLIRIAHNTIDELAHEIRWKRDLAYGTTITDTAGPVDGGGTHDPTLTEATSRHRLRRGCNQATADLRWLVDTKLPQILAKLHVRDDDPLTIDEERGADTTGGLSAYRGDTRTPHGRPDLAAALAAQRRRIDRGEGYGHG